MFSCHRIYAHSDRPRTGTLTFFDSLSGTPLVFNLSGTGIQATGTLS